MYDPIYMLLVILNMEFNYKIQKAYNNTLFVPRQTEHKKETHLCGGRDGGETFYYYRRHQFLR